jgi:hypothetical protein
MLYSSSRAIAYWFEPDFVTSPEIDYIAGSPIDRLFLSILIGIGVAILFRRKVEFFEIIKSNRWICVLFFYMGISIFWSDYMGVSFKRWVRVTGDLIMVLIILTEADPVHAITRIFRRCAYILIPLSALTIKYFRHIGVSYDHQGRESWIGLTTNKNQLSQLCFIIAFFFLWILIKKYVNKQLLNDKIQSCIDIILLIFTLWMLQGSPTVQSATAVVTFIMGAFCLITLMKLRPDPTRIWLFFVISLFFFFLISHCFHNRKEKI